MSEKEDTSKESSGGGGSAARESSHTSATKLQKQKQPVKTPPRQLPPYKVLLHNDDNNTMDRVEKVIVSLTALSPAEAAQRTREAHLNGVALLLVTHKERAELYQEQFTSAGLTTTIEPE
jgi:ATP-dependent Clp protease adaptor protein ClpS